ncbi:Gfo/Idh/MocA family protein [Paenibacillus koleovorans]|uniref:Gfo/Idh/MocA family protein n=1 Tax=Paenibacillus koleovorans TaxID=121608 RepID=UPI000FD7F2CC|nr:Gfo/Idh/MocA family oxidoreductase [Paenibacillus koleovorans]
MTNAAAAEAEAEADTLQKVLLLGLEGVRPWHDQAGVEIVGIVDLYRQAGEPFAERLRDLLPLYPVFERIEDALALAQAKPDLAVVTVPNGAKNTIWAERAVMEAGIDLVIQKPRLASLEDFEQLMQVQASSQATCYIGEHYRCDARVRTVKEALRQGRIGQVEYVYYECRRPLIPSPWMESYRHLALEDLALHHFSVLQHLIGLDVTEVYAHSSRPSWLEGESRTMASVLAGTRQGYKLTYSTAWGTWGEPTDYFGHFRLDGARGTISVEGQTVTCYSSSGVKQELPLLESRSWIELLLEARTATPFHPDSLDTPYPTLTSFEPIIRTIYASLTSADVAVRREEKRG